MKVTAWQRGLKVSGDGTGVVSHAGVALVRALADNTGLASGGSRALADARLLSRDRGRVLAGLACAIADGGEAVSGFRVLAGQGGVLGPVASVPTVWRTPGEVASGGEAAAGRIAKAVGSARLAAWARIAARRGGLPGVRMADRVLKGVTCIRMDASVVICHSEKEQAAPTFKRTFGYHPLMAYCDSTGEPLAGMLRNGNAGSSTAAGHLTVPDAAIAALPPRYRRKLMVTADGAGASHKLVTRLDELAARPGYSLTYPVGRELGERERQAIALVPEDAWQVAVDPKGEVRERRADVTCGDTGCCHRECWVGEAHVTELAGILRPGAGPGQLAGWPKGMRVFARRERPHPGAQLSLFEAGNGYRYVLRVTSLPAGTGGWRGNPAYIDAAHRVHARVEDGIRTGRDTGCGRFPSHAFAFNAAWLSAALIAATLLAWLKLIARDGALSKAEPGTLRYRILHTAARLVRSGRRRLLKISATWPWADAIAAAWQRISAMAHAP